MLQCRCRRVTSVDSNNCCTLCLINSIYIVALKSSFFCVGKRHFQYNVGFIFLFFSLSVSRCMCVCVFNWYHIQDCHRHHYHHCTFVHASIHNVWKNIINIDQKLWWLLTCMYSSWAKALSQWRNVCACLYLPSDEQPKLLVSISMYSVFHENTYRTCVFSHYPKTNIEQMLSAIRMYINNTWLITALSYILRLYIEVIFLFTWFGNIIIISTQLHFFPKIHIWFSSEKSQ